MFLDVDIRRCLQWKFFYRAGGLVQVNPLLIPHMSLYPKAKLSTIQERVEGFTPVYLELENTDEKIQ